MRIIKQGNYTYHLDDLDRVIHAEGFLSLESAPRNNYNQKMSGDEFRLQDDHGGHILGAMFGGLSEDYNLVPMNDKVNLRDFRGLEREWSSELQDGNSVFVACDVAYESEYSKRPSALMIEHNVNGESSEYNSFGNINQMLYDENPNYDESEEINYAVLNHNNVDKNENSNLNEELINNNHNKENSYSINKDDSVNNLSKRENLENETEPTKSNESMNEIQKNDHDESLVNSNEVEMSKDNSIDNNSQGLGQSL